MSPDRASPRPEGCPSDLLFDRLLAGDLRPREVSATRRHVEACATCAAHLALLEDGKARFDADPARLPLPQTPPRSPIWRCVWALPVAAAVACALLLVVVSRDPGASDERGNRRKGAPASFKLFVGRGQAVLPGGPGEVVYPGDQLQLSYSADAPGFVAILSRDGDGIVSVYFPAGERTAWPAAPGQDRRLPASTVLDETVGQETLYALHCAEPVELSPMVALVATSDAPEFPPTCHVVEIALDKREAE